MLLPSLRSVMALFGSAVAVTVTAAADAGSWTVTAMLALPPTATVPPEQVATPPLTPQVHPLSAAPVTAAPPVVAIRTVTPRAIAAVGAGRVADPDHVRRGRPPTAPAGPVTAAVRSGSLSTGSGPSQIGGGLGTSQLGRAEAGELVSARLSRTSANPARAATRRRTRRGMDHSLTRRAHPPGGSARLREPVLAGDTGSLTRRRTGSRPGRSRTDRRAADRARTPSCGRRVTPRS